MKILNNSKLALLIATLTVTSLTTATAMANQIGDKDTTMATFNTQHQGQAHLNATNKMQGMHKKMMKKRFMHVAKQLQLTSEQRQRAQQIFKNAKAEREKYQPMMKAFHQTMQSLLTASSFDGSAVLALKENYKSTFEQLGLIKARSRFDLFAMLTNEQKDKWLIIQKKRQANRMEHHGE